MKTAMIIDDEPLIRRGLESMIPWEKTDYRLIGQASNGEEGLAKIREWKPDVVFTDIKMPKMDGITMMKEALKEPSPPVFVVLSGYNDYELIRSALRLGAVDYLMKLNLEESDFIRVMEEVSERVTEKKREPFAASSADFKENLVKELLKMREDKEFYQKMGEKEISLKEGFSYRLLCVKLSELPGEEWDKNALSQNFLINICKEQMPKEVEIYEYFIEKGVFALYMESEGGIAKETMLSRCEAMEAVIKKYLNREILMGISAPHKNLMHLAGAFEEASQSIAFHISGINRKIHFYTDLLNVPYFEKQLDLIQTEPDFSEAMENFLLQFQKFLAKGASREDAVLICRRLMQLLYELDSNSKVFFVRLFGQSYGAPEDFAELRSTEAISGWLLRLEQGIISFMQQYMGEIYRYKVKKAKQFIYENRFQKLSLNDVAAELEITPNYLSRIFKKVTQKSFSDYIAEVKMEEAKKLLLQDNNRIYEVSTMLGYDDPYYFSKVFKKVTQMTPSEFIARN